MPPPHRPAGPLPGRRPARRPGAGVALALALLPAAPALGGEWSATLDVASESTERGITTWPGLPVGRLQAGWTDGQAWSAGVSATAPLAGARGARGEPAAQWSAHAAAYWVLPPSSADTTPGETDAPPGDWWLQARLGAYAYPGTPWQRFYDRTELSLGAAWRDLWWLQASAVRLTAGGQRATWALDAGLRWPLGAGWHAAAGLGRAELAGWPGWWYSHGDAGLAWQAGPWHASLKAIGQHGSRVRRLRGEAAEPRWSASVGYAF